MKTVLITLLSILSLNAFAGPEEHIAAQVCYELDSVSANGAPSEICLEEASLNLENSSISIYSYFMPYLYKDLSLNYLARRNENGYRFRSSAILEKQTDAMCGAAQESVLKISGISDNDGIVDISFLEITIEQSYTPDTCHSRPQVSILRYVLK